MDAYVPVYSQGGNRWYPSNDAAVELVHLVHAWEDISKLNEIRLKVREGDDIADKLILKHMLVEFFSTLDHAKKLQGLIRRAPKLVLGEKPPFRYITKSDFERATNAYKELWRSLAPKEQLIAKIRNNIGAHRSAEIGIGLNDLWNELDAENFIEVLNQIPTLIESVKGINIYNWSWMDAESSVGGILGSAIIHDWEDAFKPDEVEQGGIKANNPAA